MGLVYIAFYHMVRTQHLRQMASNMQLDSSSDESEQQIKVIKPKKKVAIKKERKSPADRFKRIVITVVLALIVILFFSFYNKKQTAQLSQTVKDQSVGNKYLNLQKQIKQEAKDKLVELEKEVVIPQMKQSSIQTNEQQINKQQIEKIKIAKLLEYEQIGDSYFLSQNMRQDTIHWFNKKQAKCIPDQIINSASTLTKGSLYAQKTAYQQIAVLLHNITIPAQNIYQYESPRQFIHYLVNNNIGQPVLYDHDSSLLLILTAIECIPSDNKTFLLVSDRRDRKFMQKNLIFNDLLPIANFEKHEMLINNYYFKLMITDDFKLAERLILEPQQLTIVVQIKQTKLIQQQFQERVNIYKFEEGNQCEKRRLNKWQSKSHRQDNKIQLAAGWYIFMNSGRELPQSYQPQRFPAQTNNPK